MATKAEALAALETVSKAVASAAAVVAALPDGTPVVDTTQPVPAISPSIELVGTMLHVVMPPDVKQIKWCRVNGADGHWYGNITPVTMPTDGKGILIQQQLARAGDWIVILWGGASGMDNSLKGPPWGGVANAPVTQPPVATQPPVVTVPPTPAGKTRAQSVYERLHVGINLERHKPLYIKYGNTDLKARPYYDYLVGTCGIDWLRLFVPANYTQDRGCGVGIPGAWAIDALTDIGIVAQQAGMSVVIGGVDVVDGNELAHMDDIDTWAGVCATRIASRLDPTRTLIETVNEWASGDNAEINPHRLRLDATIRRNAPGFGIVHGGRSWNGWNGYDNVWAAPEHKEWVGQFHHYEKRDDWSDVTGTVRAFFAKHGVSAFNGELGDDFGHMSQSNQDRWADNVKAFARTGNMPFCSWAMTTDGSDFRMQRSATDATLTPTLEAAHKAASTLIKVL